MNRQLGPVLWTVLLLAAIVLIQPDRPVRAEQPAAADSASVGCTLRWTPHRYVSVAEIDTGQLRLPGWYHPPLFPGVWPESLRVTAGLDSTFSETLMVRYDAWSGRHKGLTLREEWR